MRSYGHMRRLETAADAVAAGLACAARMAEGSLLSGQASVLICVLSCAAAAVPEAVKALRGLKPAANALQDGALRLVRTGIAAAAGCAAEGWAALPVAVEVRLLLGCGHPRLFIRLRVSSRIRRMQALRRQLTEAQHCADAAQNKKKAENARVFPLRIGKNPL